MTNEDRELLEMAARAMGFPFDEGHFVAAAKPGAWWGWSYIDSSGEPPEDSAWTELWNPLTSRADANALQEKLRMVVHPSGNGWRAQSYEVPSGCTLVTCDAPDMLRAITLCAAVIGRRMG